MLVGGPQQPADSSDVLWDAEAAERPEADLMWHTLMQSITADAAFDLGKTVAYTHS